jgi:glycosyltransferase involved in cell wall biosynthesis
MKVCVVTSVYARSEGDRNGSFLVECNKHLAAQGVDVHVFAPSYEGLRHHHIQGIPVYRFRYFFKRWENLTHMQGAPNRIQNPFYLFVAGFYILAGLLHFIPYCLRHRFDVIHVNWPFPHGIWGVAGCLLTGSRLVLTFHGAEILLSKRFRFVRPILRYSIHRADAVVCNSTFTAGEVATLSRRAVRVIPFGCTVDPRPRPSRQAQSVRQLLFVGRLIKRKGVDYLLRAMPIVLEERSVHLHIVSDGDQAAALRALAVELGIDQQVTFHGVVSNAVLEGLYASSDLLVLPSVVDARGDTEGLGVVLIEAMACATPVIASRIGGISDVVLDEETGLLVPQKDPEALAAAILRLLGDEALADRLAAQGLRHIQEYFSWDRITAALLQIYDPAIPSRSASDTSADSDEQRAEAGHVCNNT